MLNEKESFLDQHQDQIKIGAYLSDYAGSGSRATISTDSATMTVKILCYRIFCLKHTDKLPE